MTVNDERTNDIKLNWYSVNDSFVRTNSVGRKSKDSILYYRLEASATWRRGVVVPSRGLFLLSTVVKRPHIHTPRVW